MKSFFAIALLGIVSSPAWSCDPKLAGDDVVRIESDRHVVALRARPTHIAVSEYFALDVVACAKTGTAPDLLRVDAHMPAHRHGMNYAPKIRATAPGRWEADGLLLHMAGQWEFLVDLRAGGVADRLTYSYRLD